MKVRGLRAGAAILTALCLLMTPVRAASTEDYQKELSKLADQLVGIQKEKDANSRNLANAKTQKDREIAEKYQWESQIDLTKQEIAVLQERVDLLTELIEEKQEEIEDKQDEIDYNFDQYKKRMRASYMAGETSQLSLLLGAADFTDFLMRTEFVRATAEHDKQLVADLREARAELEEAKADLDKSMKAVEADKADMEDRQKELEVELQATESAIQNLSLQEQQYLAKQKEYEAMEQQVQAELDKIYSRLGSMGEFVGGEFGWPLPGYTTITSYYGWRFNNTNFHTGIDIAGSGVYGKSIKASNSGKVAYVNTAYTDGVGYGKYVIVDHGGGYTTLYGHMSSISVAEGDMVTRGVTEIGKVGSTGWSTGPHLHFEVRVDGKHQNPLGFLKSKG